MPILASRLRQVKETLMFHVKHSSWTQIRRVYGSRVPRYAIFQDPILRGRPTE